MHFDRRFELSDVVDDKVRRVSMIRRRVTLLAEPVRHRRTYRTAPDCKFDLVDRRETATITPRTPMCTGTHVHNFCTAMFVRIPEQRSPHLDGCTQLLG